MPDDQLSKIDQYILGTIWTSDEAMKNLTYLCDDLGHRFAGTDREHAAGEFLKRKMEDYGLQNVRVEEFPMASWHRGQCSVRLISPLERDFSAIAMPYCPTADIEADVIDVGEGELPDFERLADQIRGKIVLTDAETNSPGQRKSHRNDKFAWAIERGALACVYINQNPGMLHITGSITGKVPGGSSAAEREAAIPGIGISYEGGMTIRRLASRGPLKMRISTRNETFDSNSFNVVGEVIGSQHPEEVVLIGGHYDGHDIAQGAGDDGAGTITGLEAGRALAGLKGTLKRTVRVICFGSEEVGLLGAWHHANTHKDEKFRFVMNLDGAGRGSGGQEQVTVSAMPEMLDYLRKLNTEMAYSFDVKDELNSHSDHFPFAIHGIPNGTLNAKDSTAGMIGRGWGHTEADTLDKISLRGLQMSAILVARLAARMAQEDEFPGRTRTVDEVRQQLQDAGILERQQQSGRFPPKL